MMFLRLLCLAAAVLVLVAPPLVAFPVGAASPNARTAAGFLVCMALASGAFLLIGLAGHRLRRSALLRWLTALLLVLPCVASARVLWHGGAAPLLWMCSMMLGVALVLSLTLVYPLVRAQGHRPLRTRESGLPALPRA